MSARLIIGVASFCISMTGCVATNLITSAMIGEINRDRPNGKQISHFWFAAPKMMAISNEYQQRYPNGKLGKQRRAALITMFSGLAVTASCLFLKFH